jgi:formylglycine-generating enzyme required for sulfatase activity
VYLDGKWIGFTPIETNEVSIGTHSVKLRKEGFEDKVFTYNFGDKPIVINETFAEKSKPQEPQSTPATTPVNRKTFIVHGISFDMIQVTGGTFHMGATKSSVPEAKDDEFPIHDVTLSDYYIGKTEVTQALWHAVMGTSPSHFSGDNLPVESVSWNDCQKLIKKLNTVTGQNFRLPTEAEWEYAARGGNRSRGYKFSGSDNLASVAWCGDNSHMKTHSVATKHANELGIYDMSGNVEEWCCDRYGSYDVEAQTNPKGAKRGQNRVLRGGCWSSRASDCRSLSRSRIAPSCPFNFIGFRLALPVN